MTIFEWSRFEFNVFLKTKKSLTVVMVESLYKSVPAKMCTWYQKMVQWFISTFRQRQCEGPVIFLFALGSRDFFFCFVRLFAKGCIMSLIHNKQQLSLQFVWSRPRKSVTESGGSGEWKTGMVIGSECGRCTDGVAG